MRVQNDVVSRPCILKKKRESGSQSGLPGSTRQVDRVLPSQLPNGFLLRPGPVLGPGRPGPGSTRRAGPSFKTMVQTGTLFGYWIISRAVELGFRSGLDEKLRHRPKTFMRVQDSKRSFSSSNCSNKGEVRICPAAQTLFSVQPISRVLEV
jgi:hypothetical protein